MNSLRNTYLVASIIDVVLKYFYSIMVLQPVCHSERLRY